VNRLSFAFALLLLAPPLFAADPLAKTIDAVIDGPDFKRSHWGALVVDAKTGETLYERNADKLFAPASVTKLFSTAAALAEFGPDRPFNTPVYARGVLAKGVLTGDLILQASGDPSFGGRDTKGGKLAFADSDHTYANSGLMPDCRLTDTDPLAALDSLASQVKAAGITEVRGEVLIDDRLFARTRTTGSGPDWVCPITVNDNLIDLTITPAAKAGDTAKVTVRPETAAVTVDADVTTGEKLSGVSVTLNLVAPGQYTVRGRVPVGGKPTIRALPVEDPALFARSLFVEALRRAGVKVAAAVARPNGAPLPAPVEYAQLPQVAVFTSAPIGETFKVILKTSHNLYATALPCLLAANHGKTTEADGLKIQRKHLKELGVDVDGVSFGSGAGGNGADLASPRAAVQLLQGLRKRPDWEQFRGWLPSLGEDGTLKAAVDKDSPARGKAFAKTGTNAWFDTLNGRPLLKSKTLAGVMTTASGREVLFALFVNDVPLEPGVNGDRVGKTLGRLCEIVYDDK
jgi:serine-type D-Ala-D-Ala carboxypeptidase/endopeptidase (penicillin-binding protein 4)